MVNAGFVNIYDAKTHLSQLLDRVAGGQEVVIARGGRPVAKLVPWVQRREARAPGAWRGRVQIAEEFDVLPGEVAAAFNGERP